MKRADMQMAVLGLEGAAALRTWGLEVHAVRPGAPPLGWVGWVFGISHVNSSSACIRNTMRGSTGGGPNRKHSCVEDGDKCRPR
jgi:hypothetical protein